MDATIFFFLGGKNPLKNKGNWIEGNFMAGKQTEWTRQRMEKNKEMETMDK